MLENIMSSPPSSSDKLKEREEELKRLQDEIDKKGKENASEWKAKQKEQLEKLYTDEIAAAKAAIDAGNVGAAGLHKLKASNALNSLKDLEKLRV
jgi:hypothetical protein